jgi:hypothetical protein
VVTVTATTLPQLRVGWVQSCGHEHLRSIGVSF